MLPKHTAYYLVFLIVALLATAIFFDTDRCHNLNGLQLGVPTDREAVSDICYATTPFNIFSYYSVYTDKMSEEEASDMGKIVCYKYGLALANVRQKDDFYVVACFQDDNRDGRPDLPE